MAEAEEALRVAELTENEGIKALLRVHAEKLRAAEAKAAAAEAAREASVAAAAASSQEAVTTGAVAPSIPPAAASSRAAASGMTWRVIDSFAWDQGAYGSTSISIFVDLPEVGTVKDRVTVDFGKSSFDLKVTDLNGVNYRLLNDNLEKDIVKDKCSFLVKANKIVIKLAKVKGDYSYETWTNLTAKKKRDAAAEADKKKDPSSSIMDMMRDMYEDGDENMKRVIGEAMLKSQQGKGGEPPSPSSLGSSAGGGKDFDFEDM